jgi:hypothetical protein
MVTSLVVARQCKVSFLYPEGVRHTAEVEAESLYEAAVLAMCAFSHHDCAPRDGSALQIEVTGPSVTHSVTPARVREWLRSSAKTPSDRIVKQRLISLLEK